MVRLFGDDWFASYGGYPLDEHGCVFSDVVVLGVDLSGLRGGDFEVGGGPVVLSVHVEGVYDPLLEVGEADVGAFEVEGVGLVGGAELVLQDAGHRAARGGS